MCVRGFWVGINGHLEVRGSPWPQAMQWSCQAQLTPPKSRGRRLLTHQVCFQFCFFEKPHTYTFLFLFLHKADICRQARLLFPWCEELTPVSSERASPHSCQGYRAPPHKDTQPGAGPPSLGRSAGARRSPPVPCQFSQGFQQLLSAWPMPLWTQVRQVFSSLLGTVGIRGGLALLFLAPLLGAMDQVALLIVTIPSSPWLQERGEGGDSRVGEACSALATRLPCMLQ